MCVVYLPPPHPLSLSPSLFLSHTLSLTLTHAPPQVPPPSPSKHLGLPFTFARTREGGRKGGGWERAFVICQRKRREWRRERGGGVGGGRENKGIDASLPSPSPTLLYPARKQISYSIFLLLFRAISLPFLSFFLSFFLSSSSFFSFFTVTCAYYVMCVHTFLPTHPWGLKTSPQHPFLPFPSSPFHPTSHPPPLLPMRHTRTR